MSKHNGKTSFFGKLFRSNKANIKDDVEIQERRRDRNEVTFSNENYPHNHRISRRKNQTFVEDDLRDENGLYKPTAAYHTSTRTKPSRGTRSCYSKMNDNMIAENSSDSENSIQNRSFQSNYNPTDMMKRNRRSIKRHKRNLHTRPLFDDYDEQSSSTASYKILKSLDLNSSRMTPNMNEYWERSNRHQEDMRLQKELLLEQKYVESGHKILEYVNKYRREKHRANSLQRLIDDLTNKARSDFQMIHEQQKQIQKLQEEIERLRNSFMHSSLFHSNISYQNHLQRNSATPSSNIYPPNPGFHTQLTPHLPEMHSALPTRTVSNTDIEREISVKNFRTERDDGVCEQMISKSSLPPLTPDEELELVRCNKKKSPSVTTLTKSFETADQVPPVRDESQSVIN